MHGALIISKFFRDFHPVGIFRFAQIFLVRFEIISVKLELTT